MKRYRKRVKNHIKPLGCWALGGPFVKINHEDGGIGDTETGTIRRAADLGTDFFVIG